jgi:TrmH family RNA methyltransferase
VPHRILSFNNPHLKKIKRLHRVRSDQSQFLVEGTHLVTEALAAGWPLEALYFTDDWSMGHRALLEQSPDTTEQYLVESRWLSQAATTEHPDGVVAIALLPEPLVPVLSRDPKEWSLTLAADSIQDPGNAGSLLRSSLAMGANRLFLSPDSVSPIHPKLLRSTAGQWFRLLPHVLAMEELIPFAKTIGVQVLVAGLRGEPLWNLDLKKPTLFIVGNEGAGVRPQTEQLADSICTIPMTAEVESLNVATAGTILLYEARRQRCRTP